MSLEESFNMAHEQEGSLPRGVSKDEKSKLYGLYKQATEGDNTTEEPSMFNPLDGRARENWKAWDDVKGLSREDAMQQYISFVEEMKQKPDEAGSGSSSSSENGGD